jgi:Bifunctional DNA primase/polymerase, N-terminal
VTRAPISFAAVAMRLAERGYRPFPGVQETKHPAMRGWNGLKGAQWDLADLAAAIAEYQPSDDYCCCLAIQGGLSAIDLDIEEPSQADYANRLADAILGKTPLTRIGLAPKQVRIYRNGSDIRSRKLHPVEVFAGTGQVVGFGWHARAGRPYLWPQASPLEISADSDQVPAISRAQLDRFTSELLTVVPRRLMPTRQGRPNSFRAAQTIGERLRMLTTLHGSWRHAVAIILGEAVEGCRNETGWGVVASAAGRGVPEDVVWQLFRQHFSGWGGFSESDLTLAIERTRRSPQPSTMTFGIYPSARGGNVGRRQSRR